MKSKNLSKLLMVPILATSLSSCQEKVEDCKTKEYPSFTAQAGVRKGNAYLSLVSEKGKKIYSGNLNDKPKNLSAEEFLSLKEMYNDTQKTGISCEDYNKVEALREMRNQIQ